MSQQSTENYDSFDLKKTNTVTILDAPLNGKVYLIGTAHFSIESQKEVSELIKKVQPNCVVLELCSNRSNILKIDEETILREAKEMNFDKILKLIRETSIVNGLLQFLLINMYASVTKELGLAPGGEFRVAYKEALKIEGCKLVLGDMPINLTLSRGFNSLPWYRKIKLAWNLISLNPKLTKEDIEEMKKTDILENLVREFGASFPELKKVLIDERDMYLTHSLQKASQPIPNDFVNGGFIPACVVGVVGLGHCNGIRNNWNKEIDISHIVKIDTVNNSNRKFGKYLKFSMCIGVLAVVSYQFYKKR